MMKKLMMLPKHAAGHLKFNSNFLQWVGYYAKPGILPILLALIPTLYHYSNNVEILTLISLFRMLAFNTVLAIVIYLACLVFTRFRTIKAANAAFVFLIFFNIYGLAYRYLFRLDIARIEHYTFLPLTLMVAIYAILFLTTLKESLLGIIWKNLVLIVGVLVFFNLINIVPDELKRWKNDTAVASLDPHDEISIDKNSPDIYYIILDEFSGFQAMRDYWNYDEVDDFADFLKNRGFFVAEASHGSGKDTLRELATRLNYREYPFETSKTTYFNEIADNQAIRYLNSLGYTTVVFDERNMAYPSSKSIHADYVYEYGSPIIPQNEVVAYGFYLDEFGELVFRNTMFYAFERQFKKNSPQADHHSNMIYFTVENIDNEQVPSPKFVLVHLLLPHLPFMFDRNGAILDSAHFTNWNYYLETYIFTIRITEKIVDNILRNADPANPPVIILQSDHGVRNESSYTEGVIFLSNYPEEYKTLILNAMYIPGYDYSDLSQDIDPINTFPVVFNYLFDANITLTK
jgi:hypothetical protein